MTDSPFSRPFARTDRNSIAEESRAAWRAEHAANHLAGLLAGIDTEEAFEAVPFPGTDRPDFEATLRHLDEMAIAFDLIAALDSHGYTRITRPEYTGDGLLKASIGFDDGTPMRIEVCGNEERFNHGINGTWKAVRRLPLTLFGPIEVGGVGNDFHQVTSEYPGASDEEVREATNEANNQQ